MSSPFSQFQVRLDPLLLKFGRPAERTLLSDLFESPLRPRESGTTTPLTVLGFPRARE
jgi:hypothetical protein